MSFDAYLVFDGNCREAIEFYAETFKTKKPEKIMTYGENPGGSSEEDKDRVLYTSMPFFGHNLMLCDCAKGQSHIKGNNIILTLGLSSGAEIEQIFDGLSRGGKVYMPLGKTFFSEFFGMVCDKFGVIWQLMKIQD